MTYAVPGAHRSKAALIVLMYGQWLARPGCATSLEKWFICLVAASRSQSPSEGQSKRKVAAIQSLIQSLDDDAPVCMLLFNNNGSGVASFSQSSKVHYLYYFIAFHNDENVKTLIFNSKAMKIFKSIQSHAAHLHCVIVSDGAVNDFLSYHRPTNRRAVIFSSKFAHKAWIDTQFD